MKLIVGLGNYPKEYQNTRHNIGFLVVDEIQNNENFSSWQENKKFKGEVATGSFYGEDCILLKPSTYMNLSGESVVLVMKFYKLKPENLIVIHDEVDFDFGVVKTSTSRNSAGHNGIKSINNFVAEGYQRVRVGIGRPEHNSHDISSYVLGKFTEQEQTKLPDIIEKSILTIKSLIEK